MATLIDARGRGRVVSGGVMHVVTGVDACAALWLEQELRYLDMIDCVFFARQHMDWSLAKLWDRRVQPTRVR